MAAKTGPVDDIIRKLVEFTAARRALPRSAWSNDHLQEFRELIKSLDIFVFKVGWFATASEQATDAAYDGTICDLRARLGKLSWLMSIPRIMKVISRDRSMSGWMFQQLRERIQTITTDGPPLASSSFDEEELLQKLSEVAPAFVPMRHVHKACELDNHKRNKQLGRQGYCGRGCDLLLLQYLGFEPVLIGRVLGGFEEGTTGNRLEACKANLRNVRNRMALLGDQNAVRNPRA